MEKIQKFKYIKGLPSEHFVTEKKIKNEENNIKSLAQNVQTTQELKQLVEFKLCLQDFYFERTQELIFSAPNLDIVSSDIDSLQPGQRISNKLLNYFGERFTHGTEFKVYNVDFFIALMQSRNSTLETKSELFHRLFEDNYPTANKCNAFTCITGMHPLILAMSGEHIYVLDSRMDTHEKEVKIILDIICQTWWPNSVRNIHVPQSNTTDPGLMLFANLEMLKERHSKMNQNRNFTDSTSQMNYMKKLEKYLAERW